MYPSSRRTWNLGPGVLQIADSGNLRPRKPEDAIARGQVGSVLWLNAVKELNRLQHLAVEKSRLHIPLIVGFDVIHGYRTVFPVPLAMASSWEPTVEEAAQHLAAQDARAAGIQLTFTPMVDIARDARWGRIVEGAGEDPYLGTAMAVATTTRPTSPSPSSAMSTWSLSMRRKRPEPPPS